MLAAKKADALLNRLFSEPSLGLGYPIEDVKILNRLWTWYRWFWGIPTRLHDALRLYHQNFQPTKQFNTPYTIACANVIAANTGSKETVQKQLTSFVEATKVDEVMVVSHFYSHEDRLRSYEILGEIFKEF